MVNVTRGLLTLPTSLNCYICLIGISVDAMLNSCSEFIIPLTFLTPTYVNKPPKIFLIFQVLFACVAAASAQLVAYPNGAVAPVKTPEVQAAEAAHFAAHGYPYAYNTLAYPYAYNHFASPYAGYAGYAPFAAPFGGLVAHPNGAVVPVDEPAVQAARAEHFAAHGFIAGAPFGGLVAHPNGAVVPVDEPAVQAARAEHLAALAAAA